MNETLSDANFQLIKNFMLKHGDQRTYCNMYNDNPHYRFDGFDAYLDPEIGQRNINCDPKLSDFDVLVVRDEETDRIYSRVRRIQGQGNLVVKAGEQEALIQYFNEMLSVARLASP